MDFLHQVILSHSLQAWLYGIGLFSVTFFLLLVVRRVAGSRLATLAAETETGWDDILVDLMAETKVIFLFVLGLFVGAMALDFSSRAQSSLNRLTILAILIQTGIWGNVIIRALLERYRQRALNKDPAAVMTIHVIGLIGRIALWAIIVLLALDNIGVNVTALVAGLGIGGVAVALALQNILGDLFSSLSIMLDKPFVIGDFLSIGEYLGSVEYVGLKTTRVRSLSGEQVVFSNSDLLTSRIRNYGRMFERRVVFALAVTYDTPRVKLRRIPEIIRAAVDAMECTRFDRSHFMKYGDYALIFETVYYVLSPEYNTYMDIQQAIYFSIHESFERERIDFAYPTQTLLVTQAQS